MITMNTNDNDDHYSVVVVVVVAVVIDDDKDVDNNDGNDGNNDDINLRIRVYCIRTCSRYVHYRFHSWLLKTKPHVDFSIYVSIICHSFLSDVNNEAFPRDKDHNNKNEPSELTSSSRLEELREKPA